MKLISKKYWAYIVVKEEGSFTFIKKQRLSPTTKAITTAKNESHVIDISKPSFKKGLSLIYLIDVKEGQLTFEGQGIKYNPEILYLLTEGSTIKQLTSTLHSKLFSGNVIVMGIIGVITGIFIGLFIAGFF